MNYKKSSAFSVVLLGATITHTMDTTNEKYAIFSLEKKHGKWVGLMTAMNKNEAGAWEHVHIFPTLVNLETLKEIESEFAKKLFNMELKSVFYKKEDHTKRLNELDQITKGKKKIELACLFEKKDEK